MVSPRHKPQQKKNPRCFRKSISFDLIQKYHRLQHAKNNPRFPSVHHTWSPISSMFPRVPPKPDPRSILCRQEHQPIPHQSSTPNTFDIFRSRVAPPNPIEQIDPFSSNQDHSVSKIIRENRHNCRVHRFVPPPQPRFSRLKPYTRTLKTRLVPIQCICPHQSSNLRECPVPNHSDPIITTPVSYPSPPLRSHQIQLIKSPPSTIVSGQAHSSPLLDSRTTMTLDSQPEHQIDNESSSSPLQPQNSPIFLDTDDELDQNFDEQSGQQHSFDQNHDQSSTTNDNGPPLFNQIENNLSSKTTSIDPYELNLATTMDILDFFTPSDQSLLGLLAKSSLYINDQHLFFKSSSIIQRPSDSSLSSSTKSTPIRSVHTSLSKFCHLIAMECFGNESRRQTFGKHGFIQTLSIFFRCLTSSSYPPVTCRSSALLLVASCLSMVCKVWLDQYPFAIELSEWIRIQRKHPHLSNQQWSDVIDQYFSHNLEPHVNLTSLINQISTSPVQFSSSDDIPDQIPYDHKEQDSNRFSIDYSPPHLILSTDQRPAVNRSRSSLINWPPQVPDQLWYEQCCWSQPQTITERYFSAFQESHLITAERHILAACQFQVQQWTIFEWIECWIHTYLPASSHSIRDLGNRCFKRQANTNDRIETLGMFHFIYTECLCLQLISELYTVNCPRMIASCYAAIKYIELLLTHDESAKDNHHREQIDLWKWVYHQSLMVSTIPGSRPPPFQSLIEFIMDHFINSINTNSSPAFLLCLQCCQSSSLESSSNQSSTTKTPKHYRLQWMKTHFDCWHNHDYFTETFPNLHQQKLQSSLPCSDHESTLPTKSTIRVFYIVFNQFLIHTKN